MSGVRYFVIATQTQERGEFQTAHDVAMYMWGRDFTKYRIYKRGIRFQWIDGDLHAFEAALEQA